MSAVPDPVGPSFEYVAFVRSVVDGDTLDLDVDLGFRVWHRVRVRLDGVDAPEKRGLEAEAGKEAERFLAALLPIGTRVWARTAKPADKYGRWLARVWRASPAGTRIMDVSELLLEAGRARPYSGGKRVS